MASFDLPSGFLDPRVSNINNAFANNIGSLKDFGNLLIQAKLKERDQRMAFEQELQKAVIKSALEQQIAQSDPLNKLLREAQAAKAQTDIYNAGGPEPSLFKTQGNTGLPVAGRNPFSVPQSEENKIIPKTFDKFGRPSTFERVPSEEERVKAMLDEAEAKSLFKSEEEKSGARTKLQRMEPILQTIEKEWFKTTPSGSRFKFPGSEGIGRPLSLLSTIGRKMQVTPGQQEDEAYASFLTGIRPLLSKSLGEVGALTEQEQQAVLDLVPKYTDGLDVGMKKLKKIRGLLVEFLEKNKSIKSDDFVENNQETEDIDSQLNELLNRL